MNNKQEYRLITQINDMRLQLSVMANEVRTLESLVFRIKNPGDRMMELFPPSTQAPTDLYTYEEITLGDRGKSDIKYALDNTLQRILAIRELMNQSVNWLKEIL